MPTFHNDATLPTPTFPGSHVVLDDRYVYLSGLTAADIQGSEAILGDVGEETRWIMRRVQHLLDSVDCELADIVRADVHLTNLEKIHELDAAYADFFESPHYPARTCTQSPTLLDGANVEITLVARRSDDDDLAVNRG
ncbi:RidA family protein [Halomonas elongata]|uniref:RidA family protein n=2 Tax=Halomonas elongata TaxID=2746 RepID=E1V410_HALED|nr:RidA family protein [Halomonas elongata]MBW5799667.1 RidA family protein [Halomonas elongata]MDL4864037.1 RidA family protein [Halomonas elongata]OBX35918.1 enamine/imine deaminase [Halomonas elongata]RAW06600.1 RidA family protein [Halomonas elongata]WBF16582.1 RidA family protein [Halomonas elongata]